MAAEERVLIRTWRGEDVALHYRVARPGLSPRGKALRHPVVVVRGLGMTVKDSEGWATRLATSAGREVITLDNRGSGQSTTPAVAYTFEDMADDVAAVVEAHASGRYHVVGVSMGGVIAMKVATRHPHLVASLTIGCSYSRPLKRLGIPQEYIDLASVDLNALTPRQRTAHYRAILAFSFTAPWLAAHADRFERLLASFQVSEETRLARVRGGGKGQESALLAFADKGMADEAAAIAVPSLVLTGDGDRIVPHENSLHLHGLVPHSRLGVIPHAGHLFWETHPDATDLILSEFFALHDVPCGDGGVAMRLAEQARMMAKL
eukprot:TRINITY_DN15703_c0_g1_i1.p1 TRINITY_DN15703_c0_g1~~TRINITY_DN15703_c0_g1_i1.p1  ORF type:complete len:332 (+),score=79.60 TRINITY_DN15703_c0_g1_i1:37-996(+)